MSRLFPELLTVGEADVAAAAQPVPAPVAAPAELRGSEACVAAFASALALPVRVERVVVTDRGELRFDTVDDSGEARAVFLVPPGAPAWKRTPTFGVVVGGTDIPAGFEAPLFAFMRRYGRVPLTALVDKVRADPAVVELAPTVDEPPPPPPAPPGPLRDPLAIAGDDEAGALFYSYGAPSAWRTFFEEHDLHRGGCQSVGLRVATVKHGDIECHHSLAPMTAFGVSTFAGFRSDTDRQVDTRSEYLEVTLGEREVIFGGSSALNHVLDRLAEADDRPELVTLEPTCISLVIGDDMEVAADRARRLHGLDVAPLGCVDNPFRDALDALLGRVTRAPAPRQVQFLGIPRMAGFAAFARLLGEAGLVVPEPIVPDLPADLVASLGAASLLVALPLAGSRGQVASLCAQFPDASVIEPPVPVGLSASHACAMAIADALGCRSAVEAAWVRRSEALGAEYDDLHARASQYVVGFVVDVPTWTERLSSRLGVPMLDLVLDLGFSAEVLVYAPHVGDAEPSDDPRVRVVTYGTRAELGEAMRSSRAALFYSELRYDERVTRSGRAQFSLEDVACGLDGALDMLRRLVARCETPWFRRYGRLAGDVFRPSGAI